MCNETKEGYTVSRQGKWEYLKAIHARYHQAARAEKGRILDEFCQVTGYHRKSALRLLNGPPPVRRPPGADLRDLKNRQRTASSQSSREVWP